MKSLAFTELVQAWAHASPQQVLALLLVTVSANQLVFGQEL
jgi:hypothetical protein